MASIWNWMEFTRWNYFNQRCSKIFGYNWSERKGTLKIHSRPRSCPELPDLVDMINVPEQNFQLWKVIFQSDSSLNLAIIFENEKADTEFITNFISNCSNETGYRIGQILKVKVFQNIIWYLFSRLMLNMMQRKLKRTNMMLRILRWKNSSDHSPKKNKLHH